ncbi:hypothetical protein M5D96_004526 [Drosophila gunungcola]|uniref:Uncharacterized protein n=1 Tax=Drosophila gunungcola TaxID=103775 RepID=A0A9P9YV02_9MUSC|nr:hypothetical protein M5D96_004526 [Drosophila gunungcola]
MEKGAGCRKKVDSKSRKSSQQNAKGNYKTSGQCRNNHNGHSHI